MSLLSGIAMAQNVTPRLENIADPDARHDACLELVTQDPELAYEEALIWKGDGGGRRARHCVAIALFANGHEDEAAYRLENMAGEEFIGTTLIRANMYAESADFWLLAGEYENAYNAAHAGLELDAQHLDLRLARARAYAKLGRWEFAEIDLNSALALHPNNAKALRLRADARRRLGQLDAALKDAESAMIADSSSVESALVRGEIREQIRLKSLAHKPIMSSVP